MESRKKIVSVIIFSPSKLILGCWLRSNHVTMTRPYTHTERLKLNCRKCSVGQTARKKRTPKFNPNKNIHSAQNTLYKLYGALRTAIYWCVFMILLYSLLCVPLISGKPKSLFVLHFLLLLTFLLLLLPFLFACVLVFLFDVHLTEK